MVENRSLLSGVLPVDKDGADSLKKVRIKNMNKLVIGHININSLRYKFECLSAQVRGNVDILLISETKLDSSFPASQFSMNGYSQVARQDRTGNGGGLLLFIREDIPAKHLSTEGKPIEAFFVELNLHMNKWLLCCSYNPNKSMLGSHIEALSKSLDLYSTKYSNILVIGDFNEQFNAPLLKIFCESYNLASLVKTPTCFKNPDNPSCIDLMLTNAPKSFQNSCTIETGLSDFHKMTITVMKTKYEKLPPKVIKYRDYKNFSNENFREAFIEELSKAAPSHDEAGLRIFLPPA